jgi:hypothetical protein
MSDAPPKTIAIVVVDAPELRHLTNRILGQLLPAFHQVERLQTR